MSEGGYWYASAAFSSPEHLGTHLDAPIHFGENGWANADIPIERLFAHGVVIDITRKSNASADATLSVDDIEAWEQRNDTLQEGSIVIVRTGWASGWPDWETYYGSSTPTDVATLHFPGISPEAAQALVNRGIFGVGIDTASIDPGNSSTFEAHQILAAANVFNLENLTNVDGLPEAGFDIIALPMKIKDGTGGPARVVAIVAQR
jgi:kynurenine formamidase